MMYHMVTGDSPTPEKPRVEPPTPDDVLEEIETPDTESEEEDEEDDDDYDDSDEDEDESESN